MRTIRIKEIDEIGRIVLPIEMRKMLNLHTNDRIEIGCDQEKGKIFMRKWQPNCIFCGGGEALIFCKNRFLCRQCLAELEKAAASV